MGCLAITDPTPDGPDACGESTLIALGSAFGPACHSGRIHHRSNAKKYWAETRRALCREGSVQRISSANLKYDRRTFNGAPPMTREAPATPAPDRRFAGIITARNPG